MVIFLSLEVKEADTTGLVANSVHQITGISVGAGKLLYEKRLLKMARDLKDYGIKKDATISLVVGVQEVPREVGIFCCQAHVI